MRSDTLRLRATSLHSQTLRVCLLLYDTPRHPPSTRRERPRYLPECHAIAASLPFCGLLRNNQRVETQHSMTSCWIKGVKFRLIDDNRWSENNQIIYHNELMLLTWDYRIDLFRFTERTAQ